MKTSETIRVLAALAQESRLDVFRYLIGFLTENCCRGDAGAGAAANPLLRLTA